MGSRGAAVVLIVCGGPPTPPGHQCMDGFHSWVPWVALNNNCAILGVFASLFPDQRLTSHLDVQTPDSHGTSRTFPLVHKSDSRKAQTHPHTLLTMPSGCWVGVSVGAAAACIAVLATQWPYLGELPGD